METLSLSHTTPAHTLINDLNDCTTITTTATTITPPSSPPPTFLKMEDLHSSSPSVSTAQPHLMQNSPPPVIVHSKPAKKRKSWGQELPEPKTSLPPRKRAKTDDEKEQRRIERIKRNRAAAHNSRERKRQETEVLAVALARANAELEAYRQLHGPLPANIVLPEVTLCVDDPDTPTPSLVESHGTLEHAASPKSPCLLAEPIIKQETIDSSLLTIPSVFTLDTKSASSHSPLDLTQHSAAMLCDLPCRSSGPSPDPASVTSIWWTRLFLHLITLQLRTCYQTILMTIWSLSPSRMARWMQASTRRSTSLLKTSSKTRLLLRSMALAQHKAATRQPTSQGALLALQHQSRTRSASELTSSAVVTPQPLFQHEALDGQNCSEPKTEDMGNTENLEGV